MIVWLLTLLPEPDSPTMPSVLPASTENDRCCDRAHDPVVRAERDGEVIDLEQGHVTSGARSGRTDRVRRSNGSRRGGVAVRAAVRGES